MACAVRSSWGLLAVLGNAADALEGKLSVSREGILGKLLPVSGDFFSSNDYFISFPLTVEGGSVNSIKCLCEVRF